MQLSVYSEKQTAMTVGYGPFSLSTRSAFQTQCRLLDQYINELVGKRVAMLPGGIGRLTHYAREHGVDATCIDASELCEGLCKLEYPSVPFLLEDMSVPRESWDACFLEDAPFALNPEALFKLATNWQKHATVYPLVYTYSVVYFNSSALDDQFDAVEPTGAQYFKRILHSGTSKVLIRPSELEDFIIETYEIDLNQPIKPMRHRPKSDYQYMGIGLFVDETWKLKLWCGGFECAFSSNEEYRLMRAVPERISLSTSFKD